MDTQLLIQAAYGHRKSACHPAMRSHVLPRTSIPIDLIDPAHTRASLFRARQRFSQLRKEGAQVLWVGDRKTEGLLLSLSQLHGLAVLSRRWPGGLLTNHGQVSCSPKGQIPGLNRFPDALVFLRPATCTKALAEAQACGVETFGILDTPSNPAAVDWPIYANDDHLGVLALIVEQLVA